MLWFRRNKTEVRLKEKEKLVNAEVEYHKIKTAKEAAKTRKITDNFNKVLKENGITIKIYSAAGGRH